MIDLGVKDTAAYRIIRQLIDHAWGQDIELNDSEVISLCKNFNTNGGTWKGIMNSDTECIQNLEKTIDSFISSRIASRSAIKIIGNLSGIV